MVCGERQAGVVHFKNIVVNMTRVEKGVAKRKKGAKIEQQIMYSGLLR
jgi:hypothetical protein